MKYFRILTCVLAICSHWAFAQSDKIECLSELTDQSENAHYVIQLENQLCQEENAIKYIVCDLKLPEQEVEDQCTLNPRRILTEKKLSSDTIVIGTQSFITDLVPCNTPAIEYSCIQTDEMELARYLMAYLNQVDESLENNSRAPSKGEDNNVNDEDRSDRPNSEQDNSKSSHSTKGTQQ